jgi:hypothetical protein
VPIDWTQAEIQAILSGVDIPGGFYDLEALIASIAEAVDVDGLTETMAVTTFTGAATPESLAAASALAAQQARQIVADLTEAQLKSIAKKVKDNIAAGNAFDGLYGKLSEITGLDANRAATLEKFKQSLLKQGVSGEDLAGKVDKMHAKLLRDRKKTIAQTEQRKATENGAAEIAKNRGAKFKRWITVGDELVSDMDESNEAEGWIAFDSEFSSGDNQPPSHPNCRCTVTYRVTEPDRFDEELAEKAATDTAEAKAK